MSRPAILPLILLLTACSILGSCGGGSLPPPSPPQSAISVALGLPPQVGAGSTSPIIAQVSNDPANKGVDPTKWSISPASGAGTLSNPTSTSVTYNAPSIAPPAAVRVTITATSLSDSRVSGSADLILEPISVVFSIAPATVAVNTSVQYTATLYFDPSNGGVNWTLTQNGSACSPICGTISAGSSASGTPITYSAPATVPFPNTVTLTATSVDTSQQSSSFTITVTNPDSALNGQYAFLFNGFDDATGKRIVAAGSFMADGLGNISKGVEDINGPAGPQASVTFTGTYVIGLDNRGTMTITNSLLVNNMAKYAFSVGSFNNGVATKARSIEFDDNNGATGKRGSGFLRLQDPTTFSKGKITGAYGFGISGQDSKGNPLAAAGIFSADGAGNITGGLEDTNDAGAVANSVNITGGSYSAPDANGRATGKLTTATQITDFSLYVVSASEAFFMTTDTESIAGLQSGSVLSQVSTPYGNASLNAVSTFYEIGVSSVSPTTKSDARIGLFSPNGNGGLSITSAENDGGTFAPETTVSGLTYKIDPTGRVAITGGGKQPILYLVDSDKGFILDSSANVGSGFFEPQLGAPYNAASLCSPCGGTFFFGVVSPAVTASTVSSGIGVTSLIAPEHFSIIYILNVTQDSSNSNGTLTPPSGVTGSTDVSVFANGQVTGQVTTGGSSVMYLISPQKFVLIYQSDAAPTVSIFEQ